MSKNKKYILIAEDEPVYADIYKLKLENEGFKVTVVPNGKKLLHLVTQEKPSLILLDLVMPIMDGFKTIKKLKSDKSTNDIPVIVLSNLSKDDDITQAKTLGAVDYYIKTNVSVQEIIDSVKKHTS